jgi:hypothetical protein
MKAGLQPGFSSDPSKWQSPRVYALDAPNQFEPATRAGGWRYLPSLDPTQGIQLETILDLILAGQTTCRIGTRVKTSSSCRRQNRRRAAAA